MRNLQSLSTFRSVKSTLGRFMSIFAIIAIGCGFFAGVKAAGPDLKLSAEEYFREQKLADLHIMSTLGFEEDDFKAICSADADNSCQAGYSAEVFAVGGNINGKILKLYSYSADDKINLPLLTKGRFPEKSNECVVDNRFYSAETPQLGDKITIAADEGTAIEDIVSENEFTVVGYVQSPVYVAFERGTASVGNGVINGFVYIPKENFTFELYTDIYVSDKNAQNLSPFSDDYKSEIAMSAEFYKGIGGEQLNARVVKIKRDADEKINKAQSELTAAQKKYDDGEKSYNDGKASLDGLYKVNDRLNQTIEAYADKSTNSDAVDELVAELNSYSPDFTADDNLKTLLNTYMTSTGMVGAMVKPTAKGGLIQYADGISTAADNAQSELNNAKNTLDTAKISLDNGQKKLDEARQTADDAVNNAEIYVFNRDDYNPYYSHYAEDCDRVDAIAKVFPIFFILVAALVCTTTMTRMVEEQRIQTGTMKALGYKPVSIILQYIVYAVAASIPGAFAGLAIGLNVLPKIIYYCYKTMYTQPFMLTPFRWDYAIGCSAAACLCTGLSAYFAAEGELAECPAQLMRPKPPKNGRRILMEKFTFIWSKMKFTHKVTFRNLFRYKSRLLMTVIGIAGCTALLLTGFGLRYSIVSIVDRQYGDIFLYDAAAALDEDADSGKIINELKSGNAKDAVDDVMPAMQKTEDIYNSQMNSAEVYIVVPQSASRLPDYISLRERRGHKALALDDSGIIITEKLSRVLGVKVGDMLHFNGGKDLKISGIAENYTFNYVYITSALYDKADFVKPCENNVLFINMTDTSLEDTISDALVGKDDVLAVTFLSSGGDKFRNLVSSLSYIVAAIIVSAGALAFVVLFNLANINVNERIHELATIKVLGFYDGEVASYIYRENTVLSVLGMLAGLVLGIALEKFVVKTAEVDAVMFAPDIPMSSFLFAAAITLTFAAAVNLCLYFRLKKIDMAASLKAIE